MARYESRAGKPPRPHEVSAALRRARREWYASNPSKPDWNAVAAAQRGAYDCMRERRAA